MGKNKKKKVDTETVDSQNSTAENDVTLIAHCIEGITTNIVKSEVSGKQSSKNKSKNKDNIIPEDEKYDPKELDAFCDDLDEETNSTFNHLVSLLEAQFSGKNRKNSKLTAIKQSEDTGLASSTKQNKMDKESSTNDEQNFGIANQVQSHISKTSHKRKNIDKRMVDQELDKTSTLVSKNKRKKSKQIQVGRAMNTSKSENVDKIKNRKKSKFM